MLSVMPAGISSPQARSAAVLKEALRRLPEIPRTCMNVAFQNRERRECTPSRSVRVAVVRVRVVRVPVREALVPVRVAVRLAAITGETVVVAVMLVVRVAVLVLRRLVHVLVLMAFREMQPHPQRHQRARDPEGEAGGRTEQRQRQRGAKEGRNGKIGAGARRAEIA